MVGRIRVVDGFADPVDGGSDDERNVALCDALDVLVHVSQTRGC
ncbi:MAG: hypothetical protein QOD63_534 [Actinomycetota bacterium]|nr:hypothetical protein [Actinomycetota bacterium]